jgi:phosphatidylinositol alpha-1,6-mannosyltransferase
VNHLLVTNDFPPKVGGIQSYLWELWRRLPPERTTVLTTPYEGAAEWDAEQAYRVERTRQPILLPEPWLARHVDRLADEVDAGLVLLDPALPVGLVGPHLRHRYGVVLHGAEVAIPARLPGIDRLQRRVLRGAQLVVAAGPYPAAEGQRSAGQALPTVVVPPGVDTERFRPLTDDEKVEARRRLGLPVDGRLVVSVSRLVPRKGMDTLVRAAALLAPDRPDLTVAIAGGGRERARLDALVEESGAPVRMLGRVPDEDLPALYGCADVFAMLCRNRWSGLEQEGFGIVFLEAAACAVPQVAGDSGGAADAVTDGETGLIARQPDDEHAVAGLIARLLDDEPSRLAMGRAGRRRAVDEFAYDLLAARLDEALEAS